MFRESHVGYDVGVVAGELVRKLRARHRLSQSQLAYRAATTQQAVSRIERGAVSPTVDMLTRLAAACGEELVLNARPREVPFEDAQLAERRRMTPAERLAASASWNEFAGEIALAGARARGER